MRDKEGRWIRIVMAKGDCIVLPAGIWHRFTPDTQHYTKAMRLFVGEPVWKPYNRSDVGAVGDPAAWAPACDDALQAYAAKVGGAA